MPITHRVATFRTQGSAFVRDALHQARTRGASGLGRVRTFVLAYPPLIQGIYFVVTGLWPLLHMSSFLAVTGPKTDLWLVQTVAALILVIGVVLCVAGYRRQAVPEVWTLALGSAVALLLVDVIFVFQRRIPPIYLLDAAVEAGLIGMWIYAWKEQRRLSVAPPQ